MFVFFWMEVSMGLVGTEGCRNMFINLEKHINNQVTIH
jgi:hypothetical protein